MLRLLPILSVLLLTDCQSVAEKDGVGLTLLKQSNQCRIMAPQMRLLKTVAEIHQVTGLRTMLNVKPPPLDVDFSAQAVVLLAMGQKPTAGYRIVVDAEQAERRGATLWLPVRFTAPPTGNAAATVITSPCVVFAVARKGLRRIIAGETGLSVDL